MDFKSIELELDDEGVEDLLLLRSFLGTCSCALAAPAGGRLAFAAPKTFRCYQSSSRLIFGLPSLMKNVAVRRKQKTGKPKDYAASVLRLGDFS